MYDDPDSVIGALLNPEAKVTRGDTSERSSESFMVGDYERVQGGGADDSGSGQCNAWAACTWHGRVGSLAGGRAVQ